MGFRTFEGVESDGRPLGAGAVSAGGGGGAGIASASGGVSERTTFPRLADDVIPASRDGRFFTFEPASLLSSALYARHYMADAISAYEQERRQKRDKVRELGLDPYGQAGKGVTPLA